MVAQLSMRRRMRRFGNFTKAELETRLRMLRFLRDNVATTHQPVTRKMLNDINSLAYALEHGYYRSES